MLHRWERAQQAVAGVGEAAGSVEAARGAKIANARDHAPAALAERQHVGGLQVVVRPPARVHVRDPGARARRQREARARAGRVLAAPPVRAQQERDADLGSIPLLRRGCCTL